MLGFGVVLFVIHDDHWGVLSMPFFSSNVVAKPLIITLWGCFNYPNLVYFKPKLSKMLIAIKSFENLDLHHGKQCYALNPKLGKKFNVN